MSIDSDISLTVVIPVHKVYGYLRKCLESVLDPECPNLQVIAINDASPDGSGALLDMFAERDPRLRVRHLEANVGLGEARNIGLSMATGDYVWFIDSDDHLTDDTMPLVFRRLEETRPDVLLLDYARVYWDGRIHRSMQRHLFADPQAPEVFRLEERMELLEILPLAWNKVIRREFMLRYGLRFPKGYYEDTPVAYPVLFAAERISMLDRVSVCYRQRGQGTSITRTISAKHLDIFKQYRLIFGFLDRLGDRGEPFRKAMFDRMMWHLLIVFASKDRVPRDLRPTFFHEMSGLYNAYRPRTGQVQPGGLQGLKYRLVERDAFTLFSLLKVLNIGRLLVRGGLRRRARKAIRASARFLRGRGKRLYYRVQLRLPMDENLAVYAAYWYRGYACNPAAIYEKCRELAPWVRGVWVVRNRTQAERLPPGVEYVIAGTLGHLRVMARAKYFINNVNFLDDIVKRRGQVHLQTQHGTPLKVMGIEQIHYPLTAHRGEEFQALLDRVDRWDYLISANPRSTEVWDRSYPGRHEILEIGYPRNDRFFRATDAEVARLRAGLGIPEGAKAILYAPTHRDYMLAFEPMVHLGRLARELGDGYVILLRAHYFYRTGDLATRQGWPAGRVIDVSAHPAVEDLCLASDVLLTDYSSIMFDYANLDGRPIVIYANDWDTYVRTRGVNIDLMAEPPGAVATTETGLIEAFRSGAVWGDIAAKARAEFRRKFCAYDDGNAAERAVRRVILGERPPGPRRR
ncbi:bifunctional glycosyltransferase family 2 protein/CDP-glycerol:glycerophosphate glycerophosphotransferase [Actinomadura sp. HBU206391]|uniref:bifunctional glycosyltransferase/CDP-glycerol:glycerophosphate glycerophosphotransferase n=1 Tax=Actinomadura sp. HBU206391 TaxID=2731692 RepID=UPI00164F6C83|nr:bifunctional glycosyltransferase family 2 protein/CDP-glycerol:glycerophosphate glycerophosphotransferase [Actinomadura sp. HBU206391]MBC6458757.1 bifunctional glycosyltransferase family 2 protein/CDP-glycerol:glycerophosphate glycerophosphotransferase [Actinomadura sp. HBU206391]